MCAMKTPAERIPAEIEVMLHDRFAGKLAAGGAPWRIDCFEVGRRRFRIFASGALLEGEVGRIAVPWLILGRIEYVGNTESNVGHGSSNYVVGARAQKLLRRC